MSKESEMKEESLLLQLLASALRKEEQGSGLREIVVEQQPDWGRLFTIARQHAVLPLLYHVLEEKALEPALRQQLQESSRQTVRQSYHLAFLSRGLAACLQKQGMECLVLKGSVASAYYPVPELRKSGDIDLLVAPECLDRAVDVLEAEGLRVLEEQHANHHVSMRTNEQIEVELHTMLAEPFDHRKINVYLEQVAADGLACREIMNVMGLELPTLPAGYFAYHLLLHMLQHFLRAGFGLKLLCDWVTFWQEPHTKETKQEYVKLIRESGLCGFSDLITAVCVDYLGLRAEQAKDLFAHGADTKPSHTQVEEFLQEIWEAEEFGKTSEDRMVVMRGTGWRDYIREFHHQMQLNYPRAGTHWVCWPVLWCITLVRFLWNNKHVRGVSTGKVLKKAHHRSRLMHHMHLFES